MTRAGLVRAKTPEEIEIEERLFEIEQKRQRVALLGQEIEELKQALGRFQVEYNARVGRLYVELDKLEQLIQEHRLRIQLIVDERTRCASRRSRMRSNDGSPPVGRRHAKPSVRLVEPVKLMSVRRPSPSLTRRRPRS